MSTERDELAEEIAGYRLGEGYYAVDIGSSDAQAIADDLLAAGYRKPRTVTTVEELDALQVGAVVLDRSRIAWQKRDGGGDPLWHAAKQKTLRYNAAALYERGPFTVLDEGITA